MRFLLQEHLDKRSPGQFDRLVKDAEGVKLTLTRPQAKDPKRCLAPSRWSVWGTARKALRVCTHWMPSSIRPMSVTNWICAAGWPLNSLSHFHPFPYRAFQYSLPAHLQQ